MKIVLYGDSIGEVGRTPNWCGGASAPEKNWGQVLGMLLRDAFPSRSFVVEHFSIGGQNAYEGLGRMDWLAPYAPDLVLIGFGANDCAYHEISPEATGFAIRAMIDAVRARYNAQAVVIGPGGPSPSESWPHFAETAAAIRAAAAEWEAPYVDTRRAIQCATQDWRNWVEFHTSASDCHPNDHGHAVWAQTTFEVLKPLMAD